MLGRLPRSINVGGRLRAIRTDYRTILRIISAYGDEELTAQEKALVCLKNIYIDMDGIPPELYGEAYDCAMQFISCNQPEEDAKSPKVMDWKKDEHLIFASINKVAGFEVRSVDYMHWFTFMGFFSGIDKEDTLGYILTIRQKKAKGKKLEKWEKEFYDANRNLIEFKKTVRTKQSAEDKMQQFFNELLEEGAIEDGG